MKIYKKEGSCCTQNCSCGSDKTTFQIPSADKEYITGTIDTKIGKIPVVSCNLSVSDKFGGLKVRLNINRMSYQVEPGLYAVGTPDSTSMVLTSANYKLSFDLLRKELKGINAWILVLDTKGINVWCAAGKGTFGTDELVRRIEGSGLKEIIAHRKIIVPQLGAVGVAAHTVKKHSGFSVIYGPVRASDLPVFLASGLEATSEMRRVHFSLMDRIKVIPVEVVQGLKYFIYAGILFYLIAGVSFDIGAFTWNAGWVPVLNLLLAYIAGTVMGPLLLPWLPGRSFSFKGAVIGMVVFAAAVFWTLNHSRSVELFAWLLLIPAVSSFFTMNFTGSSTYTSLSGVKKEMRLALSAQAIAGGLGIILWVSISFKLI